MDLVAALLWMTTHSLQAGEMDLSDAMIETNTFCFGRLQMHIEEVSLQCMLTPTTSSLEVKMALSEYGQEQTKSF